MRAARIALALLVLYLLGISPPALAQRVPQPQAAEEPVRVEADTLTYDKPTLTYTAVGNAHLTRGKEWLDADIIVYNRATGIMDATGHVHAMLEGAEIWGERAHLDLEAKTGWVDAATLFVPGPGYWVRAERLERRGEDRYRAIKATLTTCLGERPAWSFRSSQTDLTMEGYATTWGTAFRVKDVPVLYTPLFVLPAKRKRQTGFLPPRPGTSSLEGFTLDAPFFWAISDSMDATVYTGLKTKRGVMEGLEHRYVLSETSRGTFIGSYMADSLDDSEFRSLGNVARTNNNRWWLRGKADQELPAGFAGRADIDLVSDIDYLREFTDGPQGFTAANIYFLDAFGRGLQEETDPIRESSVIFSRGWGVHLLSSDLHYYQDLNPATQELSLQRLPSLLYQIVRNPVPGTPLYYELRSRYDNFWREADPETAPRGQRLDILPTVSWPITFGRYANFTPAVSLRETAYLAEGKERGQDVDGLKSREVYVLEADLSTEVSRIFTPNGWGSLAGVKHIMRPELSYTYQPEVDEEELPRFDTTDRLGGVNVVALGLTNDFIGKYGETGKASYLRLARLRLLQPVDLNWLEDEPGRSAAPLRPFLGDLQLRFRRFRVNAETQWNWTESDWDRYGILANWSDGEGNLVSVDYRFLRDVDHEINLMLDWAVRKHVVLYTVQRRSLNLGLQVESTYGIRYAAQCWSVDALYTSEPWDDRVVVQFTLGGIGSLGSFGFAPGSLLGSGGGAGEGS